MLVGSSVPLTDHTHHIPVGSGHPHTMQASVTAVVTHCGTVPEQLGLNYHWRRRRKRRRRTKRRRRRRRWRRRRRRKRG